MDMMACHVTAEEYISQSGIMVMIARGREGEEVGLYDCITVEDATSSPAAIVSCDMYRDNQLDSTFRCL
jgi:hypothetical protein